MPRLTARAITGSRMVSATRQLLMYSAPVIPAVIYLLQLVFHQLKYQTAPRAVSWCGTRQVDGRSSAVFWRKRRHVQVPAGGLEGGVSPRRVAARLTRARLAQAWRQGLVYGAGPEPCTEPGPSLVSQLLM